MSPSQAPSSRSFPQAKPPSPSPSSPRTRYAPDPAAIASELHITDADVLAVIDARGGQTYAASVDTGLANRFPFVDAAARKRAVAHAWTTGAVVKTPMGVFRRPPGEDE